jgi:hypothetical protein
VPKHEPLYRYEIWSAAQFVLKERPYRRALTSAYNRYRSTNDLFEMGVMVPALVGLFMLLLSVSLLVGNAIDLNLRVYWPILLIVLGLGLIIGRRRRS